MAILQTQLINNTPTGTINIDTNGIHNVTRYASAEVQVSGAAPEYYIELGESSGSLTKNSVPNFPSTSNVTTIAPYTFYREYYSSTVPTTLDWSNITTIGDYALYYTFYNCTSLTSIDLSNLTTAGAYSLSYTFQNCTNLTGAMNLSKLTSGDLSYAFSGSGITSLDLSSYSSTTQNYDSLCYNCTSLTSADISALEDIKCTHLFDGCSNLASLALSNNTHFLNGSYMCQNCTQLRTVTGKITQISGTNAAYQTFYNARLTGIDLSELTQITGDYACYKMFYSNYLNNIDLSKLTTVSGQHVCEYMFFNAGSLASPSTCMDLSKLTTISGESACQYMFYDNGGSIFRNASVNLSGLKTISRYGCRSMFFNTGMISVDLSGLESVTEYWACSNMFHHCTSLTSANIHNLKSIQSDHGCYAMFGSCFSLVSIDLHNLETVSGAGGCSHLFGLCTSLQSFKFVSLKNISGESALQYAFSSDTALQTVYFPALTINSFGSYTNQFDTMLDGCDGVTVHFPIAIQSTIGSWSDVVNGFGGTNTTVLFDIVTTITGVDTIAYSRKEKESTNTATAWVYNDILYYTAGTNEPQIGDTIYSDSACTIAVTTINTIA